MPIFKSKDKSKNRSVNFMHVDGLPGYMPNDAINATINTQQESVDFRARVSKRPEVSLPFGKITDVVFASEQEITEKGKSVIGRAAIGSLLAGPLGAVVGGMSGLGNKQKKTTNYFVFVSYGSDEGDKTIVLQVVGASLGWDKFYKELRDVIPAVPHDEKISL